MAVVTRVFPLVLPVLWTAGCGGLPPGAQARSLDGRVLYPPPMSAAERAQREGELAEARALWLEDPTDLQAIVWYGRRLAYLGRFREAVAVYTEGLRHHPQAPELYRHRGHRNITLRRLQDAVSDLEEARRLLAARTVRVEDTLPFDVHYHLALAHYLRGDFEAAARSYGDCMLVSRDPDSLCATSHWLYTTLRRLGRQREARAVLSAIRPDMEVVENQAYHRLLLLYRGELRPEQVVGGDDSSGLAASYGVARWHIAEGRPRRGLEILRQIVRAEQWAAFGFLAAEADLARAPPG